MLQMGFVILFATHFSNPLIKSKETKHFGVLKRFTKSNGRRETGKSAFEFWIESPSEHWNIHFKDGILKWRKKNQTPIINLWIHHWKVCINCFDYDLNYNCDLPRLTCMFVNSDSQCNECKDLTSPKKSYCESVSYLHWQVPGRAPSLL